MFAASTFSGPLIDKHIINLYISIDKLRTASYLKYAFLGNPNIGGGLKRFSIFSYFM